VQVHVTATDTGSYFHTVPGRIVTMFCYFTIQSNVVVGVVSALIAVRPHRSAAVFHVFSLVALVCIIITGVVYHLVLAQNSHPVGAAAFANLLEHTVVPIAYPLGWLLFSRRGVLAARHIGWALAPPLGWLALTLIRGPIVHWYPYPFLDVIRIGYPASLLHCFFVAVFFLVLAFVAVLVDRSLHRVGRRRYRSKRD
jgi:hypothetical protein